MSREDFKTRRRQEEKNNRTQLNDPVDASRRDFLKFSGISIAVPTGLVPRVITAPGREVQVHGPGKVPIELSINHKKYRASLEPRVTLLDALRDQFGLTGAKRV